MNPNLALLTGMVLGAIKMAEDSVPDGQEALNPRCIVDREGNYTNTILVNRPSGIYCITVAMLDPNEKAI